jgi:hypothetical protein
MPNFSKAFLKTLVLMRSSLKILNVEWSWLLMSWVFFYFPSSVRCGVVWFVKFKKGQVWCGVVWFFWIGVRCGVVWFGKFRNTPGVVWCGLAKYFEKSVVWCGVASQTPNYAFFFYLRISCQPNNVNEK